MTRTALRTLAVAVFGILAMTTPAQAQSSIWSDFTPRLLPPGEGLVAGTEAEDRSADLSALAGISLGRWLDGQSSVGFDVTRLRSDLRLLAFTGGIEAGPGTPYRLIDAGLPRTALSLDLKLAWPSRAEPSAPGLLQPYVSFGPAVFVAERNALTSPLAIPSDVTLRLGVKAGAGVTWQLDRHAAFFGEYQVTRGREDAALSGVGRTAVSGYDLLYGLRFKF